MRDLVGILIHSEIGVTKVREYQGGREGGVLNTKESCGTGVNT